MSELLQVELLRRLAELELRVELLSKALADFTRPALATDPVTPPWHVTSTGNAL